MAVNMDFPGSLRIFTFVPKFVWPDPIDSMLRLLWVVCCAGLLLGGQPVQAGESTALPVYSQRYDPARDPFPDGIAALQLAKQTNRRVLIEIGGDWCSWCVAFDRFLDEHPLVRVRLHDTFVVLKVNFSEQNDNAEFLETFPDIRGYPHMFISESDGSIVHSQDTTEFLNEGKYLEQLVMQFLERWRRPDE